MSGPRYYSELTIWQFEKNQFATSYISRNQFAINHLKRQDPTMWQIPACHTPQPSHLTPVNGSRPSPDAARAGSRLWDLILAIDLSLQHNNISPDIRPAA
jgi:hypothetical protein